LTINKNSSVEDLQNTLDVTTKLIKHLTNKIHRKRAKILKKDFEKTTKELKQESWANSKNFFPKSAKKRKKRISMKKIPAHLINEKTKNSDQNK